jgi:Polyketide cyclase / dehydrase and lipid transport
MTEYAFDGTIEIAASAEQILPWLEEPELMQRWMGVGSIATTDGGIRVEVLHGGYAGWTYFGAVVERGEDRLVRRYRLAGGGDDYERTVTYQLDSGGRVRLSVDTEIQGLDERAAKMGAKAEKRALSRALDRLRDAVEGRGPGLLGRLRGSGGSAGPL